MTWDWKKFSEQKTDGSCCHWFWQQTKLECLHIINHRTLASSLSLLLPLEAVGLGWISKMSWIGLRENMKNWLMIRQKRKRMITAHRIWVGVNRKITFYLFQKYLFYTYHVLAISVFWWYKNELDPTYLITELSV